MGCSRRLTSSQSFVMQRLLSSSSLLVASSMSSVAALGTYSLTISFFRFLIGSFFWVLFFCYFHFHFGFICLCVWFFFENYLFFVCFFLLLFLWLYMLPDFFVFDDDVDGKVWRINHMEGLQRQSKKTRPFLVQGIYDLRSRINPLWTCLLWGVFFFTYLQCRNCYVDEFPRYHQAPFIWVLCWFLQ